MVLFPHAHNDNLYFAEFLNNVSGIDLPSLCHSQKHLFILVHAPDAMPYKYVFIS